MRSFSPHFRSKFSSFYARCSVGGVSSMLKLFLENVVSFLFWMKCFTGFHSGRRVETAQFSHQLARVLKVETQTPLVDRSVHPAGFSHKKSLMGFMVQVRK
jgi:hypothetical protein